MGRMMVPRVTMHIEAETDACTCLRLNGCGGILVIRYDCPEHGNNCGPTGRFHTHAKQVDRVTKGRWVH